MKPELLAPAGDFLCLKAAVSAGADAVYFGGKNFSARRAAKNFDGSELLDAVSLCRSRGVKTYLAVNVIYKNDELSPLFNFIAKAYEAGVDAFIMADIGAAVFVKKNFPEAKLCASTQTTVFNKEGAEFLKNAGFDRVVLSRELNLNEIKEITEFAAKIDLETEVFIHGALCYSYSGRCLASSFIGGRSGNRGMCGQTCRLYFDLLRDGKKISEGHLISLKDLNSAPLLNQIIGAGVTALKIEGRMKSASYVATVTGVYKDLLLNKIKIGEAVNRLSKVFNRGFTTGYFTGADENMVSAASPNGLLQEKKFKVPEFSFTSEKLREKPKFNFSLTNKTKKNIDKKMIIASVSTKDQFDAAVRENIFCAYVDYYLAIKDPDYYVNNSNGKKTYLRLPQINRESLAPLKGFAGTVARNVGQLPAEVVDLGAANDLTTDFFKDAERIGVSPELNLTELNNLSGANLEIFAYGRIPVMTAARCPVGLHLPKTEKCDVQKSVFALKDKKGYLFPIKTICEDCRAEIFNSTVVYFPEINFPGYLRLEFTTESPERVKKIIRAYNGELAYRLPEKNVSFGRFKRGVL
jgi:collagenase-like PrtC family protease